MEHKHSRTALKIHSVMSQVIGVVFFGLASVSSAADADIQIHQFKNASIRCDYLVVASKAFVPKAQTLAAHHNAFAYDDVLYGRVVDLDLIYKEFYETDTTKVFMTIHKAFKWAFQNWKIAPRYIVLMGDDSIGAQRANPAQWNRGPMPSYACMAVSTRSFYNQSTGQYDSIGLDSTFTFSDIHYVSMLDTAPEYQSERFPVAIGRIPCETIEQCSVYVDRAIQYDTSPFRGMWRNNAIFITDDAFQLIQFDPISHIESSD